MASLPKEPPEDAKKLSFWMPGNYRRTVCRTEQSYQACNDIVACFLERARVEKQYAQQLSQWSSKWKSIVDSRPLYGSLMRAWQCFFTSTERLSALHSSISQSLMAEEGDRVKTWQKETFPKKLFCGFRESHDNGTNFSRAQKPWTKKLEKLEKARVLFHKACQKEQTALDKEKQANENSEASPEKLQKFTAAREKATEEKEKTRERYEKLLEDVTSYTPRYMEEMEAIFDQSQEEERKRISFLKQAFLSIHRHLDITNNESVKAVYSELHHTLMSIDDQEDLRWWKNNHGPGMPTDWPKIEEWAPPIKKLKRKKRTHKGKEDRPVMIGGVKVRALYDYVGEEGDELSFKTGEVFLKVEEEDDQGWCRGTLSGGKEGFYPANYVEVVDLDCNKVESPMEFACEFVYVPLSVSQKAQRSNVNAIKCSALLPPINWQRPRIPPPPPPPPPATSAEVKTQRPRIPPPPPPPPPATSAEVKTQKSLLSTNKIIEQLEKSKEVKKDAPPPSFYENAEFHCKEGTASSISANPGQTSAPRKTALLPPHMRPAANIRSRSDFHPLPSSNTEAFTYDLPKDTLDLNAQLLDPDYSYNIPESSRGEVMLPGDSNNATPAQRQRTAPPLPPRPSFMKSMPLYVVVLPSSPSSSPFSQKSTSAPPPHPAPAGSADKGPLPGNPNVILVSLGKLLSEETVQQIQHKPISCSQCGSVLDSIYDNTVNICYFCQFRELTSPPSKPQFPPNGYQDGLFLLHPDEKLQSPAEPLLLFCIDISGSMSITSQVVDGEQVVYKSHLQCVQDAVLQCVGRLSEQQPEKRVGLITFNYQVAIYGFEDFPLRFLRGDELKDKAYLKEAAASIPIPLPLSQTNNCLHKQILGLSESGTTALGPAALLAIAMASRHPGSKVIICTDGKANTELGNLEVEDNDARTLLSSTIFYQELGEYAANQGVTVSVLSIEGTDCRLDELGRLADRTGGTVVIASPNHLHSEFEQIIENRTIVTHCSVTLLLPKSL
ncbi:hypothetical protein LDENG_00078820 [Lucifuga dentata]|nr:hypothetical protein LDENG_00078820 [Lucifuga dentata]